VTLQDLIVEIIGDEEKNKETEALSLQMLDEHTFLVPAQMNLEEVNQILNLDLPLAEEYHTLGGFLLSQWQKIPTQGETLEYENLDFTVTAATENRIDLVLIHREETRATDSIEEVIDFDYEDNAHNNHRLNNNKTEKEIIDGD
jgi:CBS domain containing-hemolysin-like protein